MLIIDVRSSGEFEDGHVEGALNIDISDVMQGTLPDVSKDTPIILYCRSGGRASLAKQILESAGFTDVTNGGGLLDMKNGGFEVK